MLLDSDWSQEIFKELVGQFHKLPGLLQSGCTAQLLPIYLHAKQGGSLFHFYDDLWYDLAGALTHLLPHEIRTC